MLKEIDLVAFGRRVHIYNAIKELRNRTHPELRPTMLTGSGLAQSTSSNGGGSYLSPAMSGYEAGVDSPLNGYGQQSPVMGSFAAAGQYSRDHLQGLGFEEGSQAGSSLRAPSSVSRILYRSGFTLDRERVLTVKLDLLYSSASNPFPTSAPPPLVLTNARPPSTATTTPLLLSPPPPASPLVSPLPSLPSPAPPPKASRPPAKPPTSAPPRSERRSRPSVLPLLLRPLQQPSLPSRRKRRAGSGARAAERIREAAPGTGMESSPAVGSRSRLVRTRTG